MNDREWKIKLCDKILRSFVEFREYYNADEPSEYTVRVNADTKAVLCEALTTYKEKLENDKQ